MPTFTESRPTSSRWTPKGGRRRGTTAFVIALAVAVALVAARMISSAVVPAGVLPDRLQDGLTLGMSVLIESMPFVVLGVVISIVVRIWLPDGAFVRVLPKSGWRRRVVDRPPIPGTYSSGTGGLVEVGSKRITAPSRAVVTWSGRGGTRYTTPRTVCQGATRTS